MLRMFHGVRREVLESIVAGLVLFLIVSPAVGLWTKHLPAEDSALAIPSLTAPLLDDFAVFYSAGNLVRRGDGSSIYDLETIRVEQERVTGDVIDRRTTLPYLNPPFFAAAIAPLAALPFAAAAGIFTALSVVLLATSLVLLMRLGRLTPLAGLLFVVAVLASLPAHDTLIHGQTSFFVLFAWVAPLFLLRRGTRFGAGMVWGLLIIKPQFAVLPALLLVLRREWRVLAGFLSVVFSALLLSVLLCGPGILRSYSDLLLEASQWQDQNGVSTWGMFGWNAFVRAIAGADRQGALLAWSIGLSALTALPCAWALIPRFSVESREFAAQYGLVAAASLLLSPHLYSQDLIIAVLPIAILVFMLGGGYDAPVWKAWAIGVSLLAFFHFAILTRTGTNLVSLNLAVLIGALLSSIVSAVRWHWNATEVAHRLSFLGVAEVRRRG